MFLLQAHGELTRPGWVPFKLDIEASSVSYALAWAILEARILEQTMNLRACHSDHTSGDHVGHIEIEVWICRD
jgi:hypothetical protein